MTVLERVNQIVFGQQTDLEKDSFEKLVYLAYYIGREQATREVSDKYSAHMKAQSDRAEACRYHKMAASILKNGNGYLYTPDYAQEMSGLFGSDETAY